ncbi:hypothetical protein [Luteipulveratus mongoliensis]|uniref:Flagellar biosynthetic protein FliP n=1 Tax=Luteipulveratus mongoliensis TaxID=571913 RepID=A0A0K1JK81_9MICO|nr:hypothetical protein [Luteipulveratus mongoliensis]AKU17127.1 hypothetical protein VV02_16775 [Luteipulveratus mongoliensis]
MTSTITSSDQAHLHAGWRHLARHLLEMVVAMFVGMAVLGMARAAVGLRASYDTQPELAYLLMAFDMSVGMAVLMRWRGHSWRSTAEMCAAMFAPVLLFPLIWAGVLSGHGLMMVGHIAMVPLMLAVMLWRREEYAGHH